MLSAARRAALPRAHARAGLPKKVAGVVGVVGTAAPQRFLELARWRGGGGEVVGAASETPEAARCGAPGGFHRVLT
jgi:hypothetical protein